MLCHSVALLVKRTHMGEKADVYEQHDRAFSNFSSFKCLKEFILRKTIHVSMWESLDSYSAPINITNNTGEKPYKWIWKCLLPEYVSGTREFTLEKLNIMDVGKMSVRELTCIHTENT